MSFLSGQIDHGSMKNECTMWKPIEMVSTIPAIQWYRTQLKFTPSLGKNAVKSSVSMAAAITQ